MDEEKHNKLPFLDVLVEPHSFAFVTCIYRKPMFTGLYLVEMLLHLSPERLIWLSVSHSGLLRFVRITRLKPNLNKLKIDWSIRYSEEVIVDTMNKTVHRFSNNIGPLGLFECPAYVRLPWIGSHSQLIGDKVSSSVTRSYNAAMFRTELRQVANGKQTTNPMKSKEVRCRHNHGQRKREIAAGHERVVDYVSFDFRLKSVVHWLFRLPTAPPCVRILCDCFSAPHKYHRRK